MFTPALTEFDGSTGNVLLDLAIQFILFALIVVGVMRLIGRLRQKPAPMQAALPEREIVAALDDAPADGAVVDEATGDDGTNIGSSLLALRDQAVEIRGKHATLVSGLASDFELLSNCLATMGSQVSGAVESARKSEASVTQLTVANDDFKRKAGRRRARAGIRFGLRCSGCRMSSGPRERSSLKRSDGPSPWKRRTPAREAA